ncbi:Glycine cleavage system transcriptional activator [compost metagenome]
MQASLERIAAATAKLKSPAYGGVLRVCATPSLTMKWLIPRLSTFQAQHPGIDVQLSTQARPFLDRGGDTGSDVLIRHGFMAQSDLACVHCLDDFHLPVASPRFIERNRLAAPADCLGHPLLKISGGMDHWPRWFALAKVDVPAQLPGPVFDHQFLCMQAAMNDLGIALAPWCLLEDDVRADRLRPLFSQPQLPNAGVHALYRPDGPAAAQAQLFIQWLCTQRHGPSHPA